ncbi:hypothetical protein U1Q18_004532, partial [Sarracenia purpurea var. burkii]
MPSPMEMAPVATFAILTVRTIEGGRRRRSQMRNESTKGTTNSNNLNQSVQLISNSLSQRFSKNLKSK